MVKCYMFHQFPIDYDSNGYPVLEYIGRGLRFPECEALCCRKSIEGRPSDRLEHAMMLRAVIPLVILLRSRSTPS